MEFQLHFAPVILDISVMMFWLQTVRLLIVLTIMSVPTPMTTHAPVVRTALILLGPIHVHVQKVGLKTLTPTQLMTFHVLSVVESAQLNQTVHVHVLVIRLQHLT